MERKHCQPWIESKVAPEVVRCSVGGCRCPRDRRGLPQCIPDPSPGGKSWRCVKMGVPCSPRPVPREGTAAQPRGLPTSSENHPPRQQQRLCTPFISWVLRNSKATAEKQLWQVTGESELGRAREQGQEPACLGRAGMCTVVWLIWNLGERVT